MNFKEWIGQHRYAIRRGLISPSGSYFSLEGSSSTYHDENDPQVIKYDISRCNLANTEEPAIAKRIYEEALKDHTLTSQNRERIKEALLENKPQITYIENDELPLPAAAKRLGYDGIIVWENDDWGSPSSVFIWNVAKVVKIR